MALLPLDWAAPPPVDPSDRWRDQLDMRLVRMAQPAVHALYKLHPTRVDGLEHLPKGPALLVGNHGLLGYETVLFFDTIYKHMGRMPLGLADRWFFRVPLVRDALVRLGGMYGSAKNARRALARGELVVCYPGGAREVLKKSDRERYRLHWQKSQGFVRVALEAGVPVVPFAAAGVDNAYRVVFTLPGTGSLLMGDDKYDLPLVWGKGPLPKAVPFWFRFGPPIELGHGPDAAGDGGLVERLHGRVWRQAQALLDRLVVDWKREGGGG
jgi:1-acyl-sn-glycerol-3-phosphate acyltransferase